MVSIIFKIFSVLFATVKIMIFTGIITAVLLAAQKRAFDSKRRGLVSLTSINKQLFAPASPRKSNAK